MGRLRFFLLGLGCFVAVQGAAQVEENQLEAVRDEVIGHMSASAELDVPLVVDAGFGKDWDTAH